MICNCYRFAIEAALDYDESTHGGGGDVRFAKAVLQISAALVSVRPRERVENGMQHSVGTLLFMATVVGNTAFVAAGLACGVFVASVRELRERASRSRLAAEHDSAFHHPDRIRTPLSEWIFMAGALVAVLVGLPVLLALLFEFVIPLLGRAWTQ